MTEQTRHAAPEEKTVVVLGPPQTMVEGPKWFSPPAMQVDRSGKIYLAWIEKEKEEINREVRSVYLLRTSRSKEITEKPTLVNRPEDAPDAMHQAPGLALGLDGEVYLTWSTPKSANKRVFDSDLRLARSLDGGNGFEPPIVVNDDGLAVSNGFENVTVDTEGTVYMSWIAGQGNEHKGKMLFARSKDQGKTASKNLEVDGMACPCCRTMVATAPGGDVFIGWRKTFEGSIRDVVMARSEDKGLTFSSPSLVHEDGWVFPACPHRGPSIGFDQKGRLYVTWYTEGTNGQPHIYFATSDDQGKTFSQPISLQASTTSVLEQSKMAVNSDGAVFVVWEEVTGRGSRVALRYSLDSGATFSPMQILSEGAISNPIVAVNEAGRVAFAWNESGIRGKIIIQSGTVPRLKRKEGP